MSKHDTQSPPSGIEDEAVFDWTVLKSLMDANATSMRAMEEYMCQTQFDETMTDDQTLEFIEQSIRRHEEVVEHLELARDLLDRETP